MYVPKDKCIWLGLGLAFRVVGLSYLEDNKQSDSILCVTCLSRVLFANLQ